MNDPSDLLNFPENRTTFRRKAKGSEAYRATVLGYGRFIVWRMSLFTGVIVGGLFYLASQAAGATAVTGAIAAAAVVGMGIGGLLGLMQVRENRDLFFETDEAVIEETTTDRRRYTPEPEARQRRTIQMTARGQTTMVQIDGLVLEHNGESVTLTPQQITGQLARATADNEALRPAQFVYEPGPESENNISGSQRAKVKRVLLGNGYLAARGNALYWTMDGLAELLRYAWVVIVYRHRRRAAGNAWPVRLGLRRRG